jgi:hypothetical protein
MTDVIAVMSRGCCTDTSVRSIEYTKREAHAVLREKWRRKLDWIYEGGRRARLAEIYRGDPSDPAALVREILPWQQTQLPERDRLVTGDTDANAV